MMELAYYGAHRDTEPDSWLRLAPGMAEDFGLLVMPACYFWGEYFSQDGTDEKIQSWNPKTSRVDYCMVRPSFKDHKPDLAEVYANDGSTLFPRFMVHLLSEGGCEDENIIRIASGYPPGTVQNRPWAVRHTLRIKIQTRGARVADQV